MSKLSYIPNILHSMLTVPGFFLFILLDEEVSGALGAEGETNQTDQGREGVEDKHPLP